MKPFRDQGSLLFLFCMISSCLDSIADRTNIDSPPDYAHLHINPRPKTKISNDNNLARKILRNNNLALSKSIIENNGEVKNDKKPEIIGKKLVVYRKDSLGYTANFPAYQTELRNKLHDDLYDNLHIKLKSLKSRDFEEISKLTLEKNPQNGNLFRDKNRSHREYASRKRKLLRRKRRLQKLQPILGMINQNLQKNNETKQPDIIEKPEEIVSAINPDRDRSKTYKQHNAIQNSYLDKTHSTQVRHRVKREFGGIERDLELETIHPIPNMQVVNIATVLPDDDEHPFTIKRVRPAIEIAVEKMNPLIAHHNRTLAVKFRDSKCDIADGINECINFYVRKEMDVLFGPCCDYAVAPCARQVQYWNIPMITAGALAGDFGILKQFTYRTLTRIGSNFNTLVKFFVDVLTFYGWTKLNLVYDPFGQTNISNKLCHIAASDIHDGLREVHKDKNLSHTYVKFEAPHMIPEDFANKFGIQYAVPKVIKLSMETSLKSQASDWLKWRLA